MLSFSQYFYYSTLLEAATGAPPPAPGPATPPTAGAPVSRPVDQGIVSGSTAGGAPRDTRGPGLTSAGGAFAAGVAARLATSVLTPKLTGAEITGNMGGAGYEANTAQEYANNVGVAGMFASGLAGVLGGGVAGTLLGGMAGGQLGKVAASALYDPRAINSDYGTSPSEIGITGGGGFPTGRGPGGLPSPGGVPSTPANPPPVPAGRP